MKSLVAPAQVAELDGSAVWMLGLVASERLMACAVVIDDYTRQLPPRDIRVVVESEQDTTHVLGDGGVGSGSAGSLTAMFTGAAQLDPGNHRLIIRSESLGLEYGCEFTVS